MIEITSAYLILTWGSSGHVARLSVGSFPRPPAGTDVTESVRCRPRTTRRGRTSSGSHGDDTDSDGASLAGPQPYQGDKRELPQCVTGSLQVRGGTEGHRPPESDGRIPASSGAGGGQFAHRDTASHPVQYRTNCACLCVRAVSTRRCHGHAHSAEIISRATVVSRGRSKYGLTGITHRLVAVTAAWTAAMTTVARPPSLHWRH